MVRIFIFNLVIFSNLICYWPLGDEDGPLTPWEAITFSSDQYYDNWLGRSLPELPPLDTCSGTLDAKYGISRSPTTIHYS